MREDVIKEIIKERERQIELRIGGDTEEFDTLNTANDWVAYITGYAGRATDMSKNFEDKENFRRNMVKVGALALAAIEASDKVAACFKVPGYPVTQAYLKKE
jgi:hypothetical protein